MRTLGVEPFADRFDAGVFGIGIAVHHRAGPCIAVMTDMLAEVAGDRGVVHLLQPLRFPQGTRAASCIAVMTDMLAEVAGDRDVVHLLEPLRLRMALRAPLQELLKLRVRTR